MEILTGLFLFFFGGFQVIRTYLGVLFILLAVFFAKPFIEHIKKRYIYPRAGYIKLPGDPKATGKGIAIAVVIYIVLLIGAMWISILVMGTENGLDFFLTYIVPPASGFMFAIGPYWLGQTYGLVRGYVWAVLFLLGGIAMPVFQISSGYEAVGLLCTVMGLLILATGTIMFVRFIRKYPPEPAEIEGAENAG